MHSKIHIAPKTTCLGIDVAKFKLDICLLHNGKRHREQFPNTLIGLRDLISWLRTRHDGPLSVLMESTGNYSLLAATMLHNAGHAVSVVNPRWIKDHARSDGRRNKTDSLDAEIIAHYGLTHDSDHWQPVSPAQSVLRALLRRLAGLEEMAQMEARRAETSEAVVLKSIERLTKYIAKEIASVEAAIQAHLVENAELFSDCKRLCTIPGIGMKTARWLCAELPRHLPNSRAAAAWCGLTPRLRQSGTSVRGASSIGREGNRFLRKILYMPAIVARRFNARLKPDLRS
jgi:transposase